MFTFQIEIVSKNKILVREYNLEGLIRKIENCDLHDVNIATYTQHYPKSYELVKTIKKVQRWPRMKDGTWSPFIISIMSLIQALSININMFSNTKLIEKALWNWVKGLIIRYYIILEFSVFACSTGADSHEI